MSSGATLQFYIGRQGRSTELTGLAGLTMRGTLKVLVKEGIALEPGDEFQLWEADRTQLWSDDFELDSPGEGLEWDTSRLEEGILRVQTGSGIEGLKASGQAMEWQAYTTGGALAGTFTCTPEGIRQHMESHGFAPGVYTVKAAQGQGTAVRKVTVK